MDGGHELFQGTAMSGNSWENVFSGWCVGNYVSTQGLSVHVRPVILKEIPLRNTVYRKPVSGVSE